jgi:hypothetical protein
MPIVMTDKGYLHPLFSLNLIAKDVPTDDEPRYAIPDPNGRLVIKTQLRVRAQNLTPWTISTAVANAAAYHKSNVARFISYGFDEEWAQNLEHWCQRMLSTEGQRETNTFSCRLHSQDGEDLLHQCRYMFRQLNLAASLSGQAGMLTRSLTPSTLSGFYQVFLPLEGRARDLLPLLSGHGFGQPQQESLERLMVRLADHEKSTATKQWARQQSSDMLTVIRGALLGDVTRFTQVVPLVGNPEDAARLTIGKLLGRRPDRPKSSRLAKTGPRQNPTQVQASPLTSFR